MNDISVDILQAVISHAPKEEPAADVRVLLDCERVQALAAPINVQSGEVAGELASILGNEAPFREFLLLWALDVESADFVPTEFKPVHIVGQVEHQVVLLRILLKELALRHQVLL